MSHTLKEAVHVTMTVDGADFSVDYAAGDVDLPQPIADLLVAQGLATVTKAKSSKTTTATETTEG